MKAAAQSVGGFPVGTIIPNMGAFIAWGLNMDHLKTM
jgi:mannitol-specific phosphotransferase system IIBC component